MALLFVLAFCALALAQEGITPMTTQCPKEAVWRRGVCVGTDVLAPENNRYRVRTGRLVHPVTEVPSRCCRCPGDATRMSDSRRGEFCGYRSSWGRVTHVGDECCDGSRKPRSVPQPDPVRDNYRLRTGARFLRAAPPAPKIVEETTAPVAAPDAEYDAPVVAAAPAQEQTVHPEYSVPIPDNNPALPSYQSRRLLGLDDPCTIPGVGNGNCIEVAECGRQGGVSRAGFCPGTPGNVRCCVLSEKPVTSAPRQPAAPAAPASPSTEQEDDSCAIPGIGSGKCIDVSECGRQGGTSRSGFCPAFGNNIRCCVPRAAGAPASDPVPAPSSSSSIPRFSGGFNWQTANIEDRNHEVGEREGNNKASSVQGLCANFYGVWNSYPPSSVDSDELLKAIDMPWITNTCTVRGTLALQGIGIYPGEIGKTKWRGRGGKRYLIRVAEMVPFLQATFGQAIASGRPRRTNQPEANGIDGVNWIAPAEIIGKAGIIHFSDCVFSDATGHIDVWDGYNIREHEYFHRCRRAAIYSVCTPKPNPDYTAWFAHLRRTNAA